MYSLLEFVCGNLLRVAALAALMVVAIGCGQSPSGPDRYPLSGTVKFGENPVELAELQFRPDMDLGNEGPMSIAVAEDGKYATDERNGILGGPYIVTINSLSSLPSNEDQHQVGQVSKPQFPPQTIKVDLPAKGGTHDFVIPETKSR